MKRALLFVVCFAGLSSPAVAQDATELWKFTADSDIGEHVLAPTGDLLVASEEKIALLSAATGKPIWVRDDMSHKGFWNIRPAYPMVERDDKYEYLSFLDRYVRIESSAPGMRPMKKFGRGARIVDFRDDARLLLLHLDSGKDAFDSWAHGIKPLRGTCLVQNGAWLVVWGGAEDKTPMRALALELATLKMVWTADVPALTEIRCEPRHDDLIGLRRSDKGQLRAVAIPWATGQVRWESADLGKHDSDKPLMVFADGAIVAVYSDKSGPMGLDVRTGATKWRAPLDKKDPGGRFVHRDGLLFASREKTFFALDVETGAVKWQRDQATDVVDTLEAGLLVRSRALMLLRYDTGAQLGTPMSSGQTQLVQDTTMLQVIVDDLESVDLLTGAARKLGTAPFKMESPDSIELLGDLIVLTSSQNVAAFDRSGQLKYHQYYEAPGLSGTQKFLASALAAGFNSMSYATAYHQARANARDVAFIRGGSGTGVALYRVYSPDLGVQFKATTDADRHIYMLTQRPDASGRTGFSFVRIDKTTGQEKGRVWSAERNPRSAIDAVSDRLFLKTADKELTAYGFAGRD